MPSLLGAEEFDALLRQLGPDREWGAARYEQLRDRLLAVFTYRGCANPEDLADETMDRVARRIAERPADFEGDDPTPFILGVAWNVARESFRRPRTLPLPDGWDTPDPQARGDDEEADAARQGCLDHCLSALPLKHRDLLLQYYAEDKRARITGRSRLARELAMTPNALRLKVHRLTIALRKCVFECLRHRGDRPSDAPRAVYH
jgi:DNA-directed RNA polymerase specialized sigma24 family protein